MKRLLCLLLAMVSLFALCFTLTACGEKETEGLTYEVIDGEMRVTGYEGTETEVYIPSKKDGQTVTGIDSSAFRNNTIIKKVVLPSTVTFIDTSAFEGASALTSINLEKVEVLGKKVFKEAFGRAPRVDLKMTSLMSMGTGCFELALGLKSATISGGNIVEIPVDAFSGCAGLKTVTLGNNIKTINNKAFSSCVSLETINLQNVQFVGNNSFKSCDSLVSVNLTNVRRIMDQSFYQCGRLATVVVGNNLGQFYPQAFTDCFGLTYFEIGNHDDDWCYFMSLAGSGANAGTGVINDSGYAQGSSNKITDNMSDPELWASIIKESDNYNTNSCFITKTWVAQKGLQVGSRYSYLDLV